MGNEYLTIRQWYAKTGIAQSTFHMYFAREEFQKYLTNVDWEQGQKGYKCLYCPETIKLIMKIVLSSTKRQKPQMFKGLIIMCSEFNMVKEKRLCQQYLDYQDKTF